jgi:hypothetical protein
MWLGILAGIAGLEHGYFEILQGNTHPAGLAFASWGPEICDPTKLWHACEPAMSIQRKHGGWVLIGLSIALLLFGGGFFPPLIGIIAGAAGTQIIRPLNGQPGAVTRFAARLWPWPLILLVGWLLAQFMVGYFFNDALKSVMGWVLLFIITFLPLSVYVGYAGDAVAVRN